MKDQVFLEKFKRLARKAGRATTITKMWRCFVVRRKFLAWRGRRQRRRKVQMADGFHRMQEGEFRCLWRANFAAVPLFTRRGAW